MSPPRVGPIEIPAPKGDGRYSGREPTDPPQVEMSPETKTEAAQVAEFRSGRYSVTLPAMVLVPLVTALSGAVVGWFNKPTPAAPPALTNEQAAALAACATLSKDVTELKMVVRWIEPQIGILLSRTDPRDRTDPREYSAPRKP